MRRPAILLIAGLAARLYAEPPVCRELGTLERQHAPANELNRAAVQYATERQYACAVRAFGDVLKLSPTARAHYNLAVAQLQAGQVEQAETSFKRAIGLQPRFTEALQQLGDLLIAQKRFTAAEEYLTQAVVADPANVDHAVSLAIAQEGAGDDKSAVVTLRGAVEKHPTSIAAQFNLATFLARRREFPEAIDRFNRVLTMDAANDEARLSIAKAYIALDRQPDAVAPLSEVLKRRPDDFEALYLRGLAYRGMAQYEQSVADLQEAARERPGDYECEYNLGFVLAKLGRLGDAKTHLEAARKTDPSSQEAMFQLATVLRRMGKTEEAQREFSDFEQRKKAQQQADVAGASINKANEALAHGDLNAAVTSYKAAVKLDQKNAKTYFNLALAEVRLNRLSDAEANLQQALKLDPKFSAATNQLAEIEASRGNTTEARRMLEKAIADDPACAECENTLGVLSGQAGDGAKSEALLRKALENNPKYTEARVNLGLIEAGEGRLAEARKEFEAALESEPGNVKALTALGMIQGKAKEPGAIDTFERVVRAEPQSTDAHLNLGIALADTGQKDRALNEFSRAVELAPNQAMPHYNKGRMLEDLGRKEEARKELSAACGVTPTVADACIRAATLEHEAGNEQAAVTAWKKTVELDPNNREANYALMRALSRTSPDEAKTYREHIEQIQKAHDVLDRAQTLNNFALTAEKERKWNEAIGKLREAIDVCGACQAAPVLRKNLGLIECEAGRLADGQKDLLIAQKALPGDADIQKALQFAGQQMNAAH